MSDEEMKEYQRLDRHVRTSASVRELEHWDGVRMATTLTRSHDRLLRHAVADRMRQLTNGTK